MKPNRELHIELWNWLADNPGKHKRDWFPISDEDDVLHDCFACEFTKMWSRYARGYISVCDKCPIKWGTEEDENKDNSPYCVLPGSPFHEWEHLLDTKDTDGISQIARQIANMWPKED